MSYVDGVILAKYPGLDPNQVESMLSKSLRAIGEFGVGYQDRNPSNFLVVGGGRVVVIDFESAFILEDWQDPDTYADGAAYYVRGLYEQWDFN